ncbi:hypothetical protein CAPTEDRAFT_174661 [Capitella teleta]|uniref:RING-type E3 ubiquitin transferase n=1 Tax=Capitella teleta TaxID=283909 RepID=R7TQD1_CAPTE|nr:hypothetical protein CAPTEDRAFT_174661 [Capitella teleta]|eukprot:ELT95839.1 hypothetical protein CAPTEDRAFT_174661 [Capitella teleta]
MPNSLVFSFDHVKPRDKSSKPSSLQSKPKPLSAPVLDSSASKSTLVPLRKKKTDSNGADEGFEDLVSPAPPAQENWVNAAEFVPGQKWTSSSSDGCDFFSVPGSYAAAAGGSDEPQGVGRLLGDELCPYALHGQCRYGEDCAYTHGDVCDLCGRQSLHPTNQALRDQHVKECIAKHNEDMEHSFAIQRSCDKTCGICMEVVYEKEPPPKRKFGILSSCSHVYCLDCIRQWRSSKQFEHKVIKACPECRVKSDFVTPSSYWVDDEPNKTKLIEGYKKALSGKPCRYFDKGSGECPFNERCFYLHAYPDGTKASPKPKRNRQNNAGDYDLIQQIVLWDFFEERQNAITHVLSDPDSDLLSDFFLHFTLSDVFSSEDESELTDSDY